MAGLIGAGDREDVGENGGHAGPAATGAVVPDGRDDHDPGAERGVDNVLEDLAASSDTEAEIDHAGPFRMAASIPAMTPRW